MQDYIFILLMQTGTMPARLIRFFTKKPYNHASIATDLTLDEMYSFCRTYTRFPLPATFNQEIVEKGTLGKYFVIPCEIYAIPVEHNVKLEFQKNLEHFKKNRYMFSYNILGMITTFFQIQWSRTNKLHCSQFVATLLQQSGVHLNKSVSLHTPEDLRHLPDAKLIYRGELNHFYHTYAKSMPALKENYTIA
ncbi:MAG: hypothetical protein IJZ64_03290 [Ruminococcus sp.]|nr:hypothetical protein [Ruminococcus sp.]